MEKATSQTKPGPKITVTCPFCGRRNRIAADRVPDRPRCGECRRPLLVDRPVEVSGRDFDAVIGGTDVPILVDFYADWCGPCKMMAPFVDELAGRHQGDALVAKLDTDRSPRTAESFAIRGIPTVIVFRDGREVTRVSGAMPLQGLEALLARAGTAGAAG